MSNGENQERQITGYKPGQRYGMLSYDIPKTLDDLAALVRSSIAPVALRVHESGYLIPVQNVAAVKEIVREAVLAINQKRIDKKLPAIDAPKLRILKIDASEEPEVLDWAKERQDEFVKDITTSFETRMAKVEANVLEAIMENRINANLKDHEIAARKRAILRDLKARCEDAEQAFFWFATTDKITSALKASITLFDAEIRAIKEASKLGRTEIKKKALPTSATETEKALFG